MVEARNWDRQSRHGAAVARNRCGVRRVDSVAGHGRCRMTWRFHPSPNLERACGVRVPLGKPLHGGVVVHGQFEGRRREG